jgi:hypothetical protein
MRRGVARQTGTAYTAALTQKEGGPAADFPRSHGVWENRSRRDETDRMPRWPRCRIDQGIQY